MIALLLHVALASAASDRIAVFDAKAQAGVSPTLVQGITDDLVVEVRRQAKGFTVIGMADVRAALNLERQKQLLECAGNSTCLGEIGGALGANKAVSSSLNSFGSTYLLVTKLVDSRSGKILKEASVRFLGVNELLEAVHSAVGVLFPNTEADTAPTLSFEQGDEAQPAGKSHVLAIVLGSTAVVCGGIAIGGMVDVLNYHSEATTNLKLTYPQALSAQSSAQTWQVASIVLGVAALGLATTAVLTW